MNGIESNPLYILTNFYEPLCKLCAYMAYTKSVQSVTRCINSSCVETAEMNQYLSLGKEKFLQPGEMKRLHVRHISPQNQQKEYKK